MGKFHYTIKLWTRFTTIVNKMEIQNSNSYLNSKAVLALPETASSAQTHKIYVSYELFGALYMYISGEWEKLYISQRRTYVPPK